MSNPKRPVSTVEEFIKVFHEMSARYGHSELWYDYIDIKAKTRTEQAICFRWNWQMSLMAPES